MRAIVSGTTYFALHGHPLAPATWPQYTRLAPALGSQQNYVEFQTSGAVDALGRPAAIAAGQDQDVYVPINWGLYFRGVYQDAPPAGPPVLPPIIGPVGPVRGQPRKSMVGTDGGAVALQGGLPVQSAPGLSAPGNGAAMKIGTALFTGAGRVATTQATWVSVRADFTGPAQSRLQIGICCCPTNLLLCTYAILYDTDAKTPLVQSRIGFDLSHAVGPAGSALLTRSIQFNGATLSQQSLGMPAASASPTMAFAASAVRPGLAAIDYLSPALLDVNQELPEAAQVAAPLEALGAVDPSSGLKQADFVAAATGRAGPSIGPLAASLVTTHFAGLADAFHWLGWYLTQGPGKPQFAQAYADCYTAWAAWAAKQGVGGAGARPWRSVLDASPQGFENWLEDKLFEADEPANG